MPSSMDKVGPLMNHTPIFHWIWTGLTACIKNNRKVGSSNKASEKCDRFVIVACLQSLVTKIWRYFLLWVHVSDKPHISHWLYPVASCHIPICAIVKTWYAACPRFHNCASTLSQYSQFDETKLSVGLWTPLSMRIIWVCVCLYIYK